MFSAFGLCPEEVVSSSGAALGNDVVIKPSRFNLDGIKSSKRRGIWVALNTTQ